ncbi:uncharacterized protein RAG0_03687 [Rhynchosporium agropyri]|uniref:Bola-like protein n=1 Tax=Rhynchosporium agropyri TaxID=914238 RepID=A0A1E1K5U8_9HELO|nr:uncharacterized protein RAG0_03687 [Rhynchosporium agropyri]
MDKAASAAIRRCLRSGKVLRCTPSITNTASRSRCIASAICPARFVASQSISTNSSPSTPRTPQQSSSHSILRRKYSTPSAPSSSSAIEPPGHLNPKELEIYQLLMKELKPTRLKVQDISGGCGSMYGIDVVSERFRGLGMLKQQRLVNEVLGEEIKKWHGVQLKTKAPE